MSSITSLPIQGIKERFEQIADINGLKNKFHTLDKKDTTVWSKTFVVASIVLAGLAAFAYTQARQYIAIGLGILTIGSILNSRVTVLTPEYIKQCEEIDQSFKDVASELFSTWQVASNSIAGVINTRKYTLIKDADEETPALVKAYKEGSSDSSDPFINAQENEKLWRNSFKELYPIAEEFIKNGDLKADNNFPDYAWIKLKEIYTESERLVKGSSPADPEQAYVKNHIDAETGTVISEAWRIIN